RYQDRSLPLGERLLAYAFIESIVFFPFFAWITQYRYMGYISATVEGNNWVQVEEGMHVSEQFYVYKIIGGVSKPQAEEICSELVDCVKNMWETRILANSKNKVNRFTLVKVQKYIDHLQETMLNATGFCDNIETKNPFTHMELWNDFFRIFKIFSDQKQYSDEKVLMLKGIIHILFGSLRERTTNIITRLLVIKEDITTKDSLYDYLEFINYIDLIDIYDTFSIFLKSSDLHTVSNELFVKIVYKSKNLKDVTLTVLGLKKVSYEAVIETLKRKPLKLIHILPILFDDNIIESYTTSEIMIRELISEYNIDML
ncbi:21612_t:CDS:2, partial [Racocetra persica]